MLQECLVSDYYRNFCREIFCKESAPKVIKKSLQKHPKALFRDLNVLVEFQDAHDRVSSEKEQIRRKQREVIRKQ